MNIDKYIDLDIPLHGAFLMILIVSANFLAETFPCKIQSLLKSSMVAKHFFGLLTMTFFVVLTLPNAPNNLITIVKQSFILYILFTLMSKTNTRIFITLMILLCIIYIIDILQREIESNNKEIVEKINDKNTSKEEKDKLNKELNEKKSSVSNNSSINLDYKNLNKTMKLMYILVFIILSLGFLSYLGEKKLEYKKNFSYKYFMFGKPDCRGDPDMQSFNKFINGIKNSLN